jgi:vacuolar-type H+-ATPase subunit I/STV1
MTQVRGYAGRLLATALLLAVAATGAMAESPPAETSSFRNDVDAFAASVKVQTERVVADVHRALERSTQKLVVFKARMRSKIETWRAELSDRKADFMTLSGDAATTLNAWKTVAAQSWAQICAAAADMLEDVADRMHAPSETHATRP